MDNSNVTVHKISLHVQHSLPLDVSAAMVDESGVIRTRMGMHNRSEDGCSEYSV
jgi:hypothetical protein